MNQQRTPELEMSSRSFERQPLTQTPIDLEALGFIYEFILKPIGKVIIEPFYHLRRLPRPTDYRDEDSF